LLNLLTSAILVIKGLRAISMSSLNVFKKEICMSHQKRLIIAVALITSLLFTSLPAIAQTSSTGDWTSLQRLARDSQVAVKLKKGKKVEGRVTSVTDSSLTLVANTGTVDLKREEIASVYEIKRKSATKSTLVGLGLGAGAGAALGAAVGANDNSDGFDKIDQAALGGLVVVGALAGTVTGYFLGRRSKKTLVYENK
jgi:small nuclear ribonucleoprotein (snRNP)-like protein